MNFTKFMENHKKRMMKFDEETNKMMKEHQKKDKEIREQLESLQKELDLLLKV